MPDLGDLLNVGDAIEYGGRTYTVRELTLEQGGMFAAWLKARAKADILRDLQSGDYPEDWVRLRLSVYEQDEAAGKYDWMSPASVESTGRTPVGAARALYLSLKDAHPEVTEEFALEMFLARLREVAALLARKANPPQDSSAPTASSPPGGSASPGSPTAATPATPSPG